MRVQHLRDQPPERERIESAACHLAAARESLLRAARDLDATPTRHVYRDTQGLLDGLGNAQIKLTEFQA